MNLNIKELLEINNVELLNGHNLPLTKIMFFTGKGGVGKTSISSALAVKLASKYKVLLISTDPASNLQDVFKVNISNKPTPYNELPNLNLINLDPIKSALEYKESILNSYYKILDEETLKEIDEQLSGSCTLEIAAFNEFSKLITDHELLNSYDYFIFDTAPTGHTLRMLELPSAWNGFIKNNKSGATCLGQLSGMSQETKLMYENAVKNLSNPKLSSLILVSRPEKSSMNEIYRTYNELINLNIKNQSIVINGVMINKNNDDDLYDTMYQDQYLNIKNNIQKFQDIKKYYLPIKMNNLIGIGNLKNLFLDNNVNFNYDNLDNKIDNLLDIEKIADYIIEQNKRIVLFMGKGGVGKTTITLKLADILANKNQKVLLTTTDPAAHLKDNYIKHANIEFGYIDEQEALVEYKNIVISNVKECLSKEDLDYVIEDLESPCTKEIAIFKKFADIISMSDKKIVLIDTAPTGHTLLLLTSADNYKKEVDRNNAIDFTNVQNVLPKLNSDQTEVIIVSLAEKTPIYEALRLKDDLKRANINSKYWVINKTLINLDLKNNYLIQKANNEKEIINDLKSNESLIITINNLNKNDLGNQ